METKQKAEAIKIIISYLRFIAEEERKAFSEGDTFFSLCFKTDDEITNINKLLGIQR